MSLPLSAKCPNLGGLQEGVRGERRQQEPVGQSPSAEYGSILAAPNPSSKGGLAGSEEFGSFGTFLSGEP